MHLCEHANASANKQVFICVDCVLSRPMHACMYVLFLLIHDIRTRVYLCSTPACIFTHGNTHIYTYVCIHADEEGLKLDSTQREKVRSKAQLQQKEKFIVKKLRSMGVDVPSAPARKQPIITSSSNTTSTTTTNKGGKTNSDNATCTAAASQGKFGKRTEDSPPVKTPSSKRKKNKKKKNKKNHPIQTPPNNDSSTDSNSNGDPLRETTTENTNRNETADIDSRTASSLSNQTLPAQSSSPSSSRVTPVKGRYTDMKVNTRTPPLHLHPTSHKQAHAYTHRTPTHGQKINSTHATACDNASSMTQAQEMQMQMQMQHQHQQLFFNARKVPSSPLLHFSTKSSAFEAGMSPTVKTRKQEINVRRFFNHRYPTYDVPAVKRTRQHNQHNLNVSPREEANQTRHTINDHSNDNDRNAANTDTETGTDRYHNDKASHATHHTTPSSSLLPPHHRSNTAQTHHKNSPLFSADSAQNTKDKAGVTYVYCLYSNLEYHAKHFRGLQRGLRGPDPRVFVHPTRYVYTYVCMYIDGVNMCV